MTTTPTPASQPSPAAHLADKNNGADCVALGTAQQPSPARSDKDAELVPVSALKDFADKWLIADPLAYSALEAVVAAHSIAAKDQESAPSSEGIAWHDDVRFRVFVSSVAQSQDTDAFEPAFKRLSDYIEARRATAGTTAAPVEECGNCFEGKSDGDHVCRVCNGSGRATAGNAARQYQRKVDEKIIARRDARIAELESAGNTATAAPGDLTDEDIVKVLAELGIDSDPSKYGFNTLQVRTTVPAIRDIVKAYCKVLASNTGAAPGWQTVPKAPTPLMVDCGCDCMPEGIHRDDIRAIWWAMLAAAPSNPPVGAKEEGDE